MLHTLSFYPFSCSPFPWAARSSVWWLHSADEDVEAFTASHQHLESFARRIIMFIDGFFFLLLGSTWGEFCISINMLLIFFISLLVCRSMLILFPVPKTSFIQLQVCISLTDHRWAVHGHGVSNAMPALHPSLSHACAPPHHISISTSQGLCYHTTSVFCYTTFLCYNRKTVVISYKDNKN